MKFDFVERELTWSELNEYLGDADRELPEADWLMLLQRLASQNASLALRLYLRRMAAAFEPGDSQMECALPLFEAPGTRRAGRALFAATSLTPAVILLPELSGERVVCGRVRAPLADAELPASSARSEPRLCGLEGLPLLELERIEAPAGELRPIPGIFSLGISRIVVGRLNRALKIAETYMSERRQGGRTLTQWSEPARQLSDLRWSLGNWEHALARTPPSRSLALQTRLNEASFEFVSACMDLMGGAGYMKEYGLEEIYRDVLTLAAVWGSCAEKRLWLLQQERLWPKS
ncbi:MAG TPA: acyl-CoA dehydrogenase family protein [Bdellovibrionales bacterium]|nr:acyl-CoA dehydrogenase family protein [Bdellovibrionales bacterium]